jgi:hypothetical protein
MTMRSFFPSGHPAVVNSTGPGTSLVVQEVARVGAREGEARELERAASAAGVINAAQPPPTTQAANTIERKDFMPREPAGTRRPKHPPRWRIRRLYGTRMPISRR